MSARRHRQITSPMPGIKSYNFKKKNLSKFNKCFNSKFERQYTLNLDRPCYEEPILYPEQEWHLFRLFNFYKYQSLKSLNNGHMKAAWRYICKSDQVRNQIMLCNILLASSYSRRMEKINREEREELFANSYNTIFRIIDRFDYNRPNGNGGTMRFSTYASWCIHNHNRNVHRTSQNQIAIDDEASLDALLSHDLGYDSESKRDELVEEVNDLLDYISEREAYVLRERFGIGTEVGPKTLKQIGDAEGITRERIRQIESRGLAKLQRAFTKGIGQ